jgi:hypothetical protein
MKHRKGIADSIYEVELTSMLPEYWETWQKIERAKSTKKKWMIECFLMNDCVGKKERKKTQNE